ncbi:hypothetical protein [Bacillus sp. FSL K6-3431]
MSYVIGIAIALLINLVIYPAVGYVPGIYETILLGVAVGIFAAVVVD